MNKTNTRSEDLDDISMTAQELHILSELDSRQYGYLLLHLPENEKKRELVQKAVKYLQLMVVQARRQQRIQDENEPNNHQQLPKKISIDPKTWVKLGHFHLLLEEYKKALSAYQMFYKIQAENHWMDPTFLYGLGLVYFHFNAFQWAVKSFQQLLYVSPSFQRANEVHLRLGLMFKATQEYESALKHLQLALVDNSPCTTPKSNKTTADRLEDEINTAITCEVCYEIFAGRTFLCEIGHTLCENCSKKVQECPFCRSKMTSSRNFIIEQLVAKIELNKEKNDQRSTLVRKDIKCPEAACGFNLKDCEQF